MTPNSTDTHNRPPTLGPDAGPRAPLAELTVGDDLLLYDDSTPGAWIQAAEPVALADLR
jgi:hypothetical protein